MAALIVLAFLLLATYLLHLLPNNPSRGRGPQLLLYLLVLAWMAAYSLLAGYRWASPRRGHPIPVWDLPTPPRYDPALMMGIYALVVGVILVNVAQLLFPGQDHPGAYLFALGAPAVLFVPANALLLHQTKLQEQTHG